MSPPSLLTVFASVCLLLPRAAPLLLYGCSLSDDLCEEQETCVNDGLFGQCWAPESETPPPSVLPPLDDAQLELLQLEITRLASDGYEWPDQKAQCVFSYFKLTMSYGLQYDPTFCEVRSPANIWALIQLVDIGIKQPFGLENRMEDEGADSEGAAMEKRRRGIDAEEEEEEGMGGGEEPAGAVDIPDDSIAPLEPVNEETSDQDISELIRELNEPPPEIEQDELLLLEPSLSAEDPAVQQAVEEVIEGGNPDLSALSDGQLDSLIGTVYALRQAHERNETQAIGEAEEAVPLEGQEGQEVEMLKKDKEHVGETHIGLENVEHKIVKGRTPAISRVVGNRVYLKVNIKDEEQLYPLVEFLQNTIAVPNGLLFDDFQFDKGQLSLRISRVLDDDEKKEKGEKRIDSVEGVAQAVYKRRKDIARFSGAEVAETGIGIGEDSVPVESIDRDWLLMPLLFVCAFTITALISVLAVHFYRQKRFYGRNLTAAPGDYEGKMGQAYQELCRQRMSQDAGERAAGSKHSSTSSWCEEGTAAPSIDISTGHVLLNFLQEYLNDSKRMEAQWEGLKTYRNEGKSCARAEASMHLNRTVVPYDETLLPLRAESGQSAPYLNASLVFDDDPHQAVYIAAQSPLPEQTAAWWAAVWEHEICVVVNVSSMDDVRAEGAYWPEQGSHVHGAFEVHLVSEHIWSDDYIVRSFYLKNLKNAQTRTITQFHYLSWKKDDVPPQPKTLLEFRRKVNRSYRGRSAPVLVHSSEGAGRTGTYCAIDMLCARIQRGVKEIDVVASVEHLRDQRPGLVASEAQFKLVYACVAQEVSSLLKALPQ